MYKGKAKLCCKIKKFVTMYVNGMIVFLMHQSTQQFYNKQTSNTALTFVYCVQVLPHVSALLGHHQAIIT
jgi:hypothetical protein